MTEPNHQFEEGDQIGYHPFPTDPEDDVRCVGYVKRVEGDTVIVVPEDEPTDATDAEERVSIDRIQAHKKASEFNTNPNALDIQTVTDDHGGSDGERRIATFILNYFRHAYPDDQPYPVHYDPDHPAVVV